MKKRLNEIVERNEFAKNTLILTLGTTLSQVLPLLVYPFLSRMFTPEDFGLFATLTAITAIITVIASGKYESSILIVKTQKDAINIIFLVLGLSLMFLSFVFVLFFVFSVEIGLLLNNPSISKWIIITPISAFSIIIYKLYNEWCVRHKQFKELSFNKIINATSTTAGVLILGLTKIFTHGYYVGDTIGRVLTALSSLFSFSKNAGMRLKEVSIKKMKFLARRNINFPKFLLPESLLDTVNSNLVIFAISSFFLTSEVGYFSMANAVLAIPSSVISIAVMDVFRQKANEEWQKKGNCIDIFNKTVKVMSAIVVPGSIICYFLMPSLFAVVLGEKWRTAGEYAQILLPNIAILFVFQVVSAVFIIANKMKSSFYWQFFSVFLTLSSLLIGAMIFKNMKITLMLYVLARVIANLARFYLSYKYAKN